MGSYRTTALLALAAAGLLALAGCGGDDAGDDGPRSAPAAGELTPPASTPGVPEGAAYDLDGAGWQRLSPEQRIEAAADFVADRPERCAGADPELVADYATTSYAVDFPSYAPAAEVLAEGCDASLQGPKGE